MKMKEFPTTPFEDLILGSQFVPILAKASSSEGRKEESEGVKNIGIFQCKKCKANLLQEKEALLHYKSHVLESHKEYFSVVFGGLCSKTGCVFVQRSDPSIHFHCSHCQFTACEILDLPLHMEEQHLSFYKEVSLVLSSEDAQLNKVYRCGECNVNLQGKVSIVQHLLTHENPSPSPSPATSMEISGKLKSSETVPSVNGLTNYLRENGKKETKSQSENPSEESIKSSKEEVTETDESVFEERSEQLQNVDVQEQIQIEINPLELISTLIEEDLNSDNPLIPTQHFLLGKDNYPAEDSYNTYEEYTSAEDYPNKEPVPVEKKVDPLPGLLPPLNGFPLSVESYYDSCPAPGVFQCNQCNEAFKYQYLLTAHKKQCHQGNILTPFKCHICGNEFTTINDLKRHTLSNHSPELSHFCQVCGHSFVDPLSLKQHLVDHGKSNRKPNFQPPKESNQLSSSEKTICDGCSIEFPSKSDLTRHIVKYQGTCNPNKTDSLRCATCNEVMPSLEALKEHRKVSHPPSPTEDPNKSGGRKGFQCDYCGKTFGCRSNLRDHLVVHTGDKPYPCDICGKAFSFIHNMKTHRLTHNEGRNEMCPYCDKAYKSKISLYYHMKKGNCRGLSTKEVPEGFRRCTECLQMFASEERFQSHKAKGTCQMSYRCIHCGIRCSSEDKLEKHIQKGACNKGPGDSHSSEKRRRLKRKMEHRSEEPVCCERCNNYNRDCCCTFSCRFCNKRVFSISAYMAHKRFHLSPAPLNPEGLKNESSFSAPRQKRERIRVSFMEKRKRKRKRKKRGLSKVIKLNAKKISAPSQEDGDAQVTKPDEIKESILGAEELNISDEIPVPPDVLRTPEAEEKILPPPLSEVDKQDLQRPSSPFLTPSESALMDEEDDSNSGSLTDLSTFTEPNLLKPVNSAPTASVGGVGDK